MMGRVLLIAGFVVLCFAAALGFGFLDAPDLEEDWPGWLCLGLAFYTGSKLT